MKTYSKCITSILRFRVKRGMTTRFCEMTTLLCSILILGLHSSVQAQEFLTGNKINAQIYNEVQQNPNVLKRGKNDAPPLLLPFFEDFSNYTGYPNENLFVDKQAFVNNTFPVFPPTIGVVTLDALNEKGEIYPHLNATSKGADTLTSRFIRLDSLFVGETGTKIELKDSLYFSFYFQPGGGGVVGADAGTFMGNQPNAGDSLVLEFGYTPPGDTAIKWNHIWSTPGFNINVWTSENPYQYFKQVMIPITNIDYLCDNFQFRFRNYASLEPQQGMTGWEGNVDQWHIDYIRLDTGRRISDIFSNDLAFVSPTTSLLQNYQAMPWKQFSSANVKSNFTNQLTNLSAGVRVSTYQYAITRNGNVEGSYSTVGGIDIEPYVANGIQNKPEQASPQVRFTPNRLNDTATFKITHIFQNAAGVDIYPQNDTCVFIQKFYNYYAYDDGTAEYGYCLNNPFNIAYLAMKFSPLRVRDTLTAVRMWFNHTKNDENANASFSIIVWKDDNGQPGDKLYMLEDNKPQFGNQFLNFFEYKFDTEVLIDTGYIWWVGFEQKGNTQLNIGFDQNNDSREFFRYKTGTTWETSAFSGTPMIRPVFGDLVLLKINETKPTQTTIAPNPAHDSFQVISYQFSVTRIEVYNIMGVKIDEKICNNETVQMNVANYAPGIYFVRIYKENSPPETFKLIKN